MTLEMPQNVDSTFCSISGLGNGGAAFQAACSVPFRSPAPRQRAGAGNEWPLRRDRPGAPRQQQARAIYVPCCCLHFQNGGATCKVKNKGPLGRDRPGAPRQQQAREIYVLCCCLHSVNRGAACKAARSGPQRQQQHVQWTCYAAACTSWPLSSAPFTGSSEEDGASSACSSPGRSGPYYTQLCDGVVPLFLSVKLIWPC
ncbi:unnamed protein product [Protopolystoma xenopodis]|uniref:Uncharacterized protein n=1 Tax=Protopolystoma xenopodis TaxID=117903 RepID=A0A448XSK3_9PLAT|nr:unnamed protein product [Protopolystoma xenopodis]